MGLSLIPTPLQAKYTFAEREHACAILQTDFPVQWQDIMDCLTAFTLKKSYITTPGGARSPISEVIDGFLSGVPAASTRPTGTAPSRTPVAPIGPPAGRGWAARRFDIKIEVDGIPVPIPTHKIDNFKKMPQDARGIGVEVEWNNKTEFYDRDLNNFRLLRNLGVLSVGVIITRLTELQTLFVQLGKGKSYGNSTTHWDKLIPKVDGGGAGGCPLLLVGMGMKCYDPNS
jgi:hypothetical protein